LPELNKDFLKSFTGKNVSGQNYQEIITCFVDNGYQVFLENMSTTAAHETYEEHGTDLRTNIGKDHNSLINMYDFEPQSIKAKRGMTTQKVYVAHLSELAKNIQLNYTDKIEEKILINKGRSFYEKGIWCTLKELKASFQSEKINQKNMNAGLTSEQISLIEAELIALESRIELIEKIEVSVISHLKDLKINSMAQAPKIQFGIMEKESPKKDSTKNLTNYSFLSSKNETTPSIEDVSKKYEYIT
jgi:hypothetical protein